MATLNQDQRGVDPFRGFATVSSILLGLMLGSPTATAHPPDLFPSHYEERELHEEMWLDVPDWDQEADPFKQIDDLLPTPNEVRLASGAPGPDYWQQRADHDIRVRLDPIAHRLQGSETITYHNLSPHRLDYLWVQIDQNRFKKESLGRLSTRAPNLRRDQSTRWMRQQLEQLDFDGGAEITRVEAADGTPLPHVVNGTMMRIDLPEPMESGDVVVFDIDWNAAIVPSTTMRARSGYEILDDGMPIYEIAQWFPRMAPYTDNDGWQNKQFQGESEFALEFGDYELAITVPETYVVAASGELTNQAEVMTDLQRERFAAARTAERPTFVITPEEALANELRDRELSGADGGEDRRKERTWRFRAENVRDVAWAASPTFIWDAWGVPVPRTDGDVSMAMSFWPNEGEPLWSLYSTQAIAHTIEVYSEHCIPYPYPVAISVNGPVGGMEYPMICFNGPRPEEDGTYTERTKWGLIGVIIHEVGHFWFPMIINSDERQWTWMDEGLNTFVQFLAMETWEDDPRTRRGEAHDIVDFMISERQRPIMSHGESIIQKGNNAYAKPSVALNVLRETVMGRELFDHAFRTFCERWAFRRPEPGDFFRTMDDASGVDLDWFWRNWFYTTRHVDIATERVLDFTVEPRDPEVLKPMLQAERKAERPTRTRQRNADLPKRSARYPELLDFYSRFDEREVTDDDRRRFERFMARLDQDDRAVFEAIEDRPLHFSIVRFRNHGGIPMPLPLEIRYADGTVEETMLPVEIWKEDPEVATRMFVGPSPIARVLLDPYRELADADRTNNAYPPEVILGRFAVQPRSERSNPMQDALARDGRPAIERAAIRIAVAILPGWADLSEDGDTPLGQSGTMVRDLDPDLLIDPWNRPMALEFSGDPNVVPGSDAILATLRSDGRDGRRGTDDDVALVILADGQVHDEAIHLGRMGDDE
ncbi:MAG: M1 family metallopeptidase [Planctomycetota bacterium]|nr:M1 family metallopeptidase [Planctomycetota bacterium]